MSVWLFSCSISSFISSLVSLFCKFFVIAYCYHVKLTDVTSSNFIATYLSQKVIIVALLSKSRLLSNQLVNRIRLCLYYCFIIKFIFVIVVVGFYCLLKLSLLYYYLLFLNYLFIVTLFF